MQSDPSVLSVCTRVYVDWAHAVPLQDLWGIDKAVAAFCE